MKALFWLPISLFYLLMIGRLLWVPVVRNRYIRHVRPFMHDRISRFVYFGRDKLFFEEQMSANQLQLENLILHP